MLTVHLRQRYPDDSTKEPWEFKIVSNIDGYVDVVAENLRGCPSGGEAFRDMPDNALMLRVLFETGDVKVIAPYPTVQVGLEFVTGEGPLVWNAPKALGSPGMKLPADGASLSIGPAKFTYSVVYS